MKKIFVLILLLVTTSNLLMSQGKVSDESVGEYLKYVAHGRVSEVKMILPDLLAEYPNDPGVKLLHAVVIEDASKALDIYKKIVQDYPQSIWADDAYWRIIQYYAIMGEVEKSQYELSNFRKRYPSSTYLGPATDVVRSAERMAPLLKEKTMIAQTQPVVVKETAVIKGIYTEPIANIPAKEDAAKVETNTVVPPAAPQKTMAAPPVKKANNNTFSSDEVKSGTRYGLQVGIYRELVSAENEKNKYLEKRIRTSIMERIINGETMYAVIVGDYSSKDRAEKAKKIVQRECNCQPIVLEK